MRFPGLFLYIFFSNSNILPVNSLIEKNSGVLELEKASTSVLSHSSGLLNDKTNKNHMEKGLDYKMDEAIH